MKSFKFYFRLLLLPSLFTSGVQAQNVGIGTATPLEKLHVIGNIRSSTLAGVGNRMVLADPNGTLIISAGTAGPAWLVTGNSGLSGGTTTTPGTNFLGNTDAQNICFRTNNIERGRFSALGEFFVGTLNTVITGDLMNAVGNPTFPWAVNGYVPSGSNGGGVYGQVQNGNGTIYASVQGEYAGTNASGAGVRGIAINATSIGVQGQEPTLLGWAGYFNGDVFSTTGYYIPSDRQLKRNIHPYNGSLNIINKINVYSYNYNVETYKNYGFTDKPTIGFMADEIEDILPTAVAEKNLSPGNISRKNPSNDLPESKKIKVINYSMLIPLLVEGIQEQQKQIEVLNKKIEELENKTIRK